MTKFDRRFANGSLRVKDIDRHLQENPSEPVFEFLRNKWGVKMPSPSVRVIYAESAEIDTEMNYIELSASEIERLRRVLERGGRKISGNDMLKTLVGEKFSILASMKSTPANWDSEFCLYNPEYYTLDDFERFVSVSTQLSSIGEIGAREIERQQGIYDPVRTGKAFEIMYIEIGKMTKVNEKKELKLLKNQFRKLAQINQRSVPPSKNSISEVEKRYNEYLDTSLQTAIAGTTTLYVADDVEAAYHNNLPALMTKSFGTNPEYVEYFNAFVKHYMPDLAKRIEGTIPLFKKA